MGTVLKVFQHLGLLKQVLQSLIKALRDCQPLLLFQIIFFIIYGNNMNTNSKIPVTILTGFLGSGKTTLLNRILSEHHGKRIAVIENEYGEINIDHALVINADEEIFEMSNGCICCTVRGDLIRVLGNLMKRRDKFDYVLIETTGLADPGPVA